MARKINKERLKSFVLNRKLNAFGLLSVTLLSVLITVFCAIRNFPRTNILLICTLLLIVLCFVQQFRMHSSFRRLPSFKGRRRKRKKKAPDA